MHILNPHTLILYIFGPKGPHFQEYFPESNKGGFLAVALLLYYNVRTIHWLSQTLSYESTARIVPTASVLAAQHDFRRLIPYYVRITSRYLEQMVSGARRQKGFSTKELLKFIFRMLEGDENEDDDVEGNEEATTAFYKAVKAQWWRASAFVLCSRRNWCQQSASSLWAGHNCSFRWNDYKWGWIGALWEKGGQFVYTTVVQCSMCDSLNLCI